MTCLSLSLSPSRCVHRTAWSLAFLLLVLFGSPSGAQTDPPELSDPTSGVYYRYAVVAEEEVQVGGSEIVGNVHSNDLVKLQPRSGVEGDVTAVGSVEVRGTVDGSVEEEAEPLLLPEIEDEESLRDRADRVFEEDLELIDEIVDDVVFVTGDVRVRGSLNGRGAIFATGSIRFAGAAPGAGNRATEAQDEAQDEMLLSLVALEDVRIDDDREFRGVIRAGRDIQLEKALAFDGVLIAGRRVLIKKDSEIRFEDFDVTPPQVELLEPADGSVLPVGPTEIVLSVTDDLSGVRFDTLNVTLDGEDVTAQAQIEGDRVTLSFDQPLADGVHDLAVTVLDGSDNEAAPTFQFLVEPPTPDTTPPTISVIEPSAAVLVNERTPALVVEYADDRRLDLTSLVVRLNEVTLTSACDVGPSRATCIPRTPLAAFEHRVDAEIRDAAGNLGTASRAFELVIDEPDESPPTLEIFTPLPGITVTTSPVLVSGTLTGDQVTVEVNGMPATVEGDVFSMELDLQEGSNTVTVVASNPFGTATESAEVVLDSTPPELVLESPVDDQVVAGDAVTVRGTATDASGVVGLTVNGAPVELAAGGAFETQVTLAGDLDTLTVTAVDDPGLVTTRDVTVDRGEPPTVAVDFPAEGALLRASPVTVEGPVTGEDVAVTVAGVTAEVDRDAQRYRAEVPLADGTNVLAVEAASRFGTASTSVQVSHVSPPRITITQPGMLTLVSGPTVTVTGTVDDPDATVSVNGVAATVTPGTPATYSAQVPVEDGKNTLLADAVDAAGEMGTATVVVVVDATPPRITIDRPADGSAVRTPTVVVTGMVHDVGVGTVDGAPTEVRVNGLAADVSGSGFLVPEVPLTPGSNVLTVEGVDKAGNVATATSTVIFDDSAGGPLLEAVGGENQTARISSLLPDPLMVRLSDELGEPLAGRDVIFRVVENNGLLTADGPSARAVVVVTDAQGLARAQWSLGEAAGVGNQVVEAQAVGVPGKVVFTATGLPAEPAHVLVDSGNFQVGAVNQNLPLPLVVVVTDAGFNRLSGVPVEFEVLDGGGSIGGSLVQTVVTGLDGSAAAELTLGSLAGIDVHRVVARVPDSAAGSAQFVATGRIPGDPADTSLSGVVLDPVGEPLSGVTVQVDGTPLSAPTDAQGRFFFQPVPVGAIHVEVDGSTVDRPGTWPTLEYEVVTLAGHDNTVGTPIHLLPLDVENGVVVSETEGATLTLPDLPGFSLTIEPGSATFPDGSRSGLVSVTPVHADKMPMAPNFGQQPRLVFTVQPTGVRFDPPARLTLPNVDGLVPGQISEMYSFDHDLNQFVSLGPAFVSEDGLTLISAPGVGIVEGGWHCGSDPAPAGDCCDCEEECKKCENGTCVPDDGKKPSEPPCETREKGAEFQTASQLASQALSKIPYVSNVVIEGAVNATVCPTCCGGGPIFPGEVGVGGSVTASAEVEKVLSPIDYEFEEDVSFFGFDFELEVEVELGPKVTASPSITVAAQGSRDLCTGEGCVTFSGCGTSGFTAGAAATFEVEIEIEDDEFEFEVSAEIFAAATAAAKVQHAIGADCEMPGTTVDGCISPLTGNLVVSGFGLSSSIEVTLIDGDEECGC